MTIRTRLLVALCALCLRSAVARAADVPDPAAAKAFHELLAADWQHQLEIDPVMATAAGDPRYADRWPAYSIAALDAEAAYHLDLARRLRQLDSRPLDAGDGANHELLGANAPL